jgi:hypothetical protein
MQDNGKNGTTTLVAASKDEAEEFFALKFVGHAVKWVDTLSR